MMDARRLAYLEAMDIDVWQPRSGPLGSAPTTAVGPLIALSEGDGAILCLARTAKEAGQKLAFDISSAMKSQPVWAWPNNDADGVAGATTLPDAVADRLFTQVLIFGSELATVLFGDEVPGIIGAAKVQVVPGLERLSRDRNAKRVLWQLMCEQGLAARAKSGKTGS